MRYDVEFDSGAFYPAAGTVELAQLAEDHGFEGVWKGKSNSTDPIVHLSAMAARTSTIKLGTAIYHIYGRSPVTLGIQAATLNDLSDGRVLLAQRPEGKVRDLGPEHRARERAEFRVRQRSVRQGRRGRCRVEHRDEGKAGEGKDSDSFHFQSPFRVGSHGSTPLRVPYQIDGRLQLPSRASRIARRPRTNESRGKIPDTASIKTTRRQSVETP